MLVATAAEDVATLGRALDSISEALDVLKGHWGPFPVVMPSQVELRAMLLHVPPGQPVPIRSQVGQISGDPLSAPDVANVVSACTLENMSFLQPVVSHWSCGLT